MSEVRLQVERRQVRMKIKAFARPEKDGMNTVDLNAKPCPVIMANGLGGVSHSQYYIEDDGRPMPETATDKPPYSVPTMDEVRAIPWNGLTVASTFSGGGGSSTGYRMAGYKVAWASEFIEAARKTYAANMNPDTVLDARDIREVARVSLAAGVSLQRAGRNP